MTHLPTFPQRIVCLTEETTETLYLLEEDWRIVGISGFTVRPPRARKEKPRVSAFTSAKIDRIVELQPDLVLGSLTCRPISRLNWCVPVSKYTCSITAVLRKRCA